MNDVIRTLQILHEGMGRKYTFERASTYHYNIRQEDGSDPWEQDLSGQLEFNRITWKLTWFAEGIHETDKYIVLFSDFKGDARAAVKEAYLAIDTHTKTKNNYSTLK